MKKIFKYPLEIKDKQVIAMPDNAEILCVQMQAGTPCLWALVDPEEERVNRTILTFGTGHPIDEKEEDILYYIDTYQHLNGTLVFHVFEQM